MKRNFLFLLFLFAVLTLFISPARTFAANQVVTDCTNDIELRADIIAMQSSGGGTLTFNCGTATITLTSQLPDITTTSATTIDGGNKITLSGNDLVSVFSVRPDSALVLKNIVLDKGYRGNSFGGAISNEGYLTLKNATIQYSHTPYDGGAIANFSHLEMIDSTLAHNYANNGGAIYADELGGTARVKITNSKFQSNHASDSGGALFANTPFEIIKSEFVDNKSPLHGGAIYARAQNKTSSIKDSTFRDNFATDGEPNPSGGALLVEDTTVNIQNTLFNHNVSDQGAGIYVKPAGKVAVTNSTFTDHFSLYGGGVYNEGSTSLTNVTLEGNGGLGSGGGIENYGDLTLTNVTVSKNGSLMCGGVCNKGGSAFLTNVTLASNSGTQDGAGGILNTGPTTALYLKNVIVSQLPDTTDDGANCRFEQAPTISESNLSDDASCNFGTGRDNVDLQLGELAANGGVTKTHLPKAGSPVIDGGTNANCPSTDQRSVARPQGANCDVGAVEVKLATPTPTPPACSGIPSKPVLLKPGDTKKVKGPAVKLDWSDANCAQSFKVIVRQGSPKGTRIEQKGGLTQSEFTTKSLTKGQTYTWRVIAFNSTGKNKSAWWTFQVK
jgi:hypothetical protein